MTEQDQRRFRRLPTRQSVWVEGQDVRVDGEAHNISRGGLFVVTHSEAPEVGATLSLQFDDPHEGRVEVKTQVVWRDETTLTCGLGLRVLDSAGMAAFERVVDRHERAVRAAGDRASEQPPADDAVDE